MGTVGQGNYSVWGQVVLVAKHLYGGVAHLGERLLCKQDVASSILVTSTIFRTVSSAVEQGPYKAKVKSSILLLSTKFIPK